MSAKTANRLIELMDNSQGSIKTLYTTGGAPEMMEQFRPLVAARAGGIEVIDRCNLTVLFEPGQEDLPAFLAGNGVKVVASLPCYSEKNTDKQRGTGVFSRSIVALVELNKVGYGVKGTGLELDLMYNTRATPWIRSLRRPSRSQPLHGCGLSVRSRRLRRPGGRAGEGGAYRLGARGRPSSRKCYEPTANGKLPRRFDLVP
jgi:radical SAM/Cys-rich protein